LERYSNRQHDKLKLGDFIGEIAYEGAGLAEFLPLLRAGELLHIGGSTSFGLGRYESDTTRKAGGLMSGVASKAITLVN
jgi:hypothetical protein